MNSTPDSIPRPAVAGVVGATGVLPDSVLGVLAEARETQRVKRLVFARELELAAHLADLSGAVEEQRSGLPSVERLVQLGHDGTPEVAEFTSLELAAALQLSVEAADAQMRIALDLRHRLPGLWALVMDGSLDAWKAKELALATADLDHKACLLISGMLAAVAMQLPWRRLKDYADALVLEHLPQDEANAKQQAALDRRRVDFTGTELGATDINGTMSTADAVHLDAAIDWIARILADGGNQNRRDVRRAQALGVLATPARALQLMQASLLDQLPDDLDTECPRQGSAGHTCGAVTVDPDRLLPKSELVVHLTDATLAEGAGTVRIDGLGVMLGEWAGEMLGQSRITVRPVIDTNRIAPVDAYEIPKQMRRAVTLRNPHDVFPWSSRRAKSCDLDHTQPYQPTCHTTTAHPVQGQTRMDNLAPLGRRAHRAKTHGRWRMAQPVPGVVLWRSPHGLTYLVTPSGTHELHIPEYPIGPTHPDWGLTVHQRRQRRARQAERHQLASTGAPPRPAAGEAAPPAPPWQDRLPISA